MPIGTGSGGHARFVHWFVPTGRVGISAVECLFGDNLYARWLDIHDLAGEIPGDDVATLRSDVQVAWTLWDHCLIALDGALDQCELYQIDYEEAFIALYDALR